ncbi:hypothetical protein FF38_03484 [Lucilia cuprina]|uniref:Uncharacterized protein n=1 Tax=Lucilia cuprina TaxID=7375 RepID=A0A0L0BNT9_LUCCU|nr:hypothetical protein FF38_03484 [Lucilia cuprina]
MVLGEGEAANQVSMNNQRSALHIFKNKIPEPMKTILACRNPTSLEAAMDILYENGYDRMGKDGNIYSGKTKQIKGNQNDANSPQSNSGKDNYKKKYQADKGHGNYRQNDNSRENSRHTYKYNVQDQRWQNSQNYNNNNQIGQPQSSDVEPMDVNNVENFQQTASTENYHI